MALAAALLAGCGLGGAGAGRVEGPVTVYLSLPLTGPDGADGRDAADGARLALERAGGRAGGLEVRARYLDDAGGRRPGIVAAAANARRATSDSSSAAYIGELDSATTRTSMPITNQAGLVQVSPGATAADLTRPAPGFEGAPGRYRPSGDPSFARVIGIGAEPLAPSALPDGPGRRFRLAFRRRFGRAPGPYAAYGAASMDLVLAAISAAQGGDGFRREVRDAVLGTGEHASPLGRFGIDENGDTTICGGGPC